MNYLNVILFKRIMGSGSSKTKSKSPETEKNANVKDSNNTENISSENRKEKSPNITEESSNIEIIQTDKNDSAPILSTVAAIDEEKGTIKESEVSFAEFPTHSNLRLANDKHKKNHKPPKKNKDGTLPVFPSFRRKVDFWTNAVREKLDKIADQVILGD